MYGSITLKYSSEISDHSIIVIQFLGTGERVHC